VTGRRHLVRAEGVEGVELDDEVLLWTGTELHLLSGGAAPVWRATDGVSTLDEITTATAHSAGVDRAVVEPETVDVVDRLLRAGLVEERAGSPGPRWTVPPGVGWVRDGDVVVVSRHGSGARDALSPTAARIFELAWSGLGLGDLVDTMGAEFPDAPPHLEDDVTALLAQLEAGGYLRRTGTP
jgi:hypothetical protein